MCYTQFFSCNFYEEVNEVKKFLSFLLCGIVVISATMMNANACTLIYVGEDASEDGSSYIARSEDLERNHNKIFKVIPAADHEEGETYVDPYGYTLEYPSHTYRYTVIIDDPEIEGADGIHDYPEVGFNEKNVYVSATVSTGYNSSFKKIDKLVEDEGIAEMSMAAVMLQEATSAKHAMEILAREIDKKGAAECNIVVASDPNETWMMEIVSGHQYAAVKLNKDEVAVIPNFMVLDNIGRYEDAIVSKDLLKVAVDAKTAKFVEGQPETVENLLVAESYTSGFSSSSSAYRFWGGAYLLNKEVSEKIDPANLTALPDHKAFYEPTKKVTLSDVMNIEAYRYEGTPYDTDKTGFRAIGAETQMEIHIAQFRPNMEDSLSGIQWQAFANGEFTVYIPYFTNLITDTHSSYRVEDIEFNENSYYWNFEKVMLLCAQNRELYGQPVKEFWKNYQEKLFVRQSEIDEIMKETPTQYRSEVATQLGMEMAEDVLQTEKTIRELLENHIANQPNELFVIENVDNNLPEIGLEKADYSKVNEAVKKAEALDAKEYKDFSGVKAALDAVEYDLYYTQQEKVDNMAKAILDAIDALVKNQAGSPNTADTSQMVLYISVAAMALAVLAFAGKKAGKELN